MLASTSTVRRFPTLLQTTRRKKDRIRTSGNIFLLRNAAAAAVEGWREEGGILACHSYPVDGTLVWGGSDITRTVLYSRQDGADERSNEQNVKPRQILPLAAGRWMDAGMGK